MQSEPTNREVSLPRKSWKQRIRRLLIRKWPVCAVINKINSKSTNDNHSVNAVRGVTLPWCARFFTEKIVPLTRFCTCNTVGFIRRVRYARQGFSPKKFLVIVAAEKVAATEPFRENRLEIHAQN